jgi:hypothetical protein
MPGAQFAFFTSTYACTICVYENLRTLRASASIRLRKLEIPNSNRNSTAWVKIAKPTKCTTSMKPFVSIALVTRWPELSYKRKALARTRCARCITMFGCSTTSVLFLLLADAISRGS